MKYLSHRLSAAMWARVLLLWLMLSVGAVVVGGIALWLGNFMHSNVRAELESQQITFTAADRLSDAERAIPGVVENAGLPLTTGNQAQVYANIIGLHMQTSAETAGYPGEVYASLGGIQRELRAALAEATESGDEAAIEEAKAKLDAVNNLRNTMLTGNNLRGNLFSAYGWDNVATGITTAGIAVIVLGLAFFGLFLYERSRGHLPPTDAR